MSQEEDHQKLLNLRQNAPYTWRCSTIYYEIAEHMGVPILAYDALRDAVIDRFLGGQS